MRAVRFINSFGWGLFIGFGLFWLLADSTPGTTFAKIHSAVGWIAVISLLFGILFGVLKDALHESKI